MPEIKELNVKAREVNVGDQLIAIYDPAVVKSGKKAVETIASSKNIQVFVTAKNNATKLTHLETGLGKISFESDAELLVGRSVKTDAEKAAEDNEYIEKLLDKFVADMRATAGNDPLVYLNEKMKGYEHDVARGLSWYLEDAMVMSHRQHYAAAFVEWLERDVKLSLEQPEPGDQHEGAQAVGRRQVFLGWCAHLEKELIQTACSMSRSTNPASNLSDDCKLKTLGMFLDDFNDAKYLRIRLLHVEEG